MNQKYTTYYSNFTNFIFKDTKRVLYCLKAAIVKKFLEKWNPIQIQRI